MPVLCRDLNFLFLCVPKTGCSAVARVLTTQFAGIWLPNEDLLSQTGEVLCSRKHGSVEDLLEMRLITESYLEELCVVATTRDPFDWLLSQYFWGRSVYEAEGENSNLAWVNRHIDVYRHAYQNEFPQHVEHYWLGKSSSVSWRWEKHADVVLRYEYLRKDLNAVIRRRGIDNSISLPLVNLTPNRPPGILEHYPQELITKVSETYADDIWRHASRSQP